MAYKRYPKINELSDEVLEERLRNIKGMVEHWDWQIVFNTVEGILPRIW